MQREIKFRGLRTDGKGWVYGYYYATRKGTDDPLDIHIIVQDDGSNSWRHEVLPESVGQWLGLTDKNGAEVYEGDILEVEGGMEICTTQIYWDDELCGFFDKRNLDGDSFTHYEGDLTWVEDHLIIGNIHQNPELIGKEANNG
jgi:uncharacterized phage protein (TIGR01671 family)